MRVLFAGPSFGATVEEVRTSDPQLKIRPPAAWGDVAAAVNAGASVIGIVDGYFESTRSVWHKEILYALSKGVKVAGASSIGALRAAECHYYGMTGIGKIFQMYADGRLIDDSDVALVHAPEELDYQALSLPRVNLILTLRNMRINNLISWQEEKALNCIARRLFYAELSIRAIFNHLPNASLKRISKLINWAERNCVDQKRKDAHQLAKWIKAPVSTSISEYDWRFNATSQWAALHNSLSSRPTNEKNYSRRVVSSKPYSTKH